LPPPATSFILKATDDAESILGGAGFESPLLSTPAPELATVSSDSFESVDINISIMFTHTLNSIVKTVSITAKVNSIVCFYVERASLL
jgi:hypothetical protein